MSVLTISELNRYVAVKFQTDSNLKTVFVRGEISNFKRNFKSGHCYFTLRDEEAAVSAVMFRFQAARLQFEPADGMHVMVQGAVTLYEPTGSYQLNITDMQPDGIGAQALALKQRREKLAKLGYFDAERKRPLPPLPKKIGIVTSASGAAKHDMIETLAQRCPLVTVCVYPCLVQGQNAPQSIADALILAGADGCDVILVGRGGGSAEDLSAFQEEVVAHAIFGAPVPVISAVGHETDQCIADDVADYRAMTPTAAATMAVPDIRSLMQSVTMAKQRLNGAFTSLCEQKQAKLERLTSRLQMQAVDRRVALQSERFSALIRRFHTAMERGMTYRQQQWELACGRLEANSPVAILQRGYALVYDEKQTLVRSADTLSVGEKLRISFANGSCNATVTEIEGANTHEV